ncbi:MAG TPA: hypothetical protein VK681_39030 [Reyranella sp.]|nr:hypothetical protein [Reyranella sp.]
MKPTKSRFQQRLRDAATAAGFSAMPRCPTCQAEVEPRYWDLHQRTHRDAHAARQKEAGDELATESDVPVLSETDQPGRLVSAQGQSPDRLPEAAGAAEPVGPTAG